ncbi:MAG: type II secretion system protein M [Candidatus Competibacteraceae bacterium]
MKAWWDNLSPRERGLISGGVVLLLALLFYVLAWEPFQASNRRLRQSIAEQRADLAWMRQAAAEVKRLSAAHNPAAQSANAGQSLLTVVDQTARGAGLGTALKRITPQGNDKLNAQLEQVEFDKLIAWLGALERQQHVTIINIVVDRTGAAGLVNARIILQSSLP